MIFLSLNNIRVVKNNGDFIPKLQSEILGSLILNKFVEKENLMIDDKPDVFNLSRTHFYEITQCDLEEDLARKYIWKAILECNFDYQSTINTLAKNKNVNLSKFLISSTKEGKVASISSSEYGRAPYYYIQIFEHSIDKKMKKLNSGSYGETNDIRLVILSISRLKTNDDVRKIFEIFNKINNRYTKRFTNLYLITTSGLYYFEKNNICNIRFKENEFNDTIKEASCLIQKIRSFNSLYSEQPDIAFEWHPTKNQELKPFDISIKSNRKVWWKCSKGHDFEGIIYNRVKQQSKCPICANKKVLEGYNDLATTHPLIASEWDYEKNNPKKPTEIRCGTDKKYWWICPKCKQSYFASPNIRTSQKTGCPYCSGRKVLKGVNDLLTKRPEIAKEWNYEKNGDLLPSMVTEKSGKKVWWKCSKGHEWECAIDQRTVGKGTQCPQCQSGLSTSFPELTIFYYVKKYFKDAINRYKDISKGIPEIDIFIPSKKIGIEYNGCHYHESNKDLEKKINIEKCGINLISIFESKKPIEPFVKEKDIYINQRFSYSEFEFILRLLFKLLDLKVNPELNIEKDSIEIYKMQAKIINDNSLFNKRPKLVEEWNYEKNNGLTPHDFNYSSHFSVWWKCSNGHEWKAPINNRAKENGTKCPYCSNSRVLEGYNDFASLHSELLCDWDYNKNKIKPNEIVEKSNKIIFWKCHKCGHEWKSSPAIRIKKECPHCSTNNRRQKVLNVENGHIFNSILEAALWLGDKKYVSGISLACHGKRSTAYGYHWELLK